MNSTRQEIYEQVKLAGQALEAAVAESVNLRMMLQDHRETQHEVRRMRVYTLPTLEGMLSNPNRRGSLAELSRDIFDALGSGDFADDPDYLYIYGPFDTLKEAEAAREIEGDEAYGSGTDGKWAVFRHVVRAGDEYSRD